MPPVTVMIKPVSGACNMRCRYCFYADEMSRRGESIYPAMQDDMLETLVRRVMMYADGQATFAFQGGEPTLAGLDFFRLFVAMVNTRNTASLPVRWAIQTNGLHLNQDWAAFLAENRFLVGVSIDGDRATHDAFRRDQKKLIILAHGARAHQFAGFLRDLVALHAGTAAVLHLEFFHRSELAETIFRDE